MDHPEQQRNIKYIRHSVCENRQSCPLFNKYKKKSRDFVNLQNELNQLHASNKRKDTKLMKSKREADGWKTIIDKQQRQLDVARATIRAKEKTILDLKQQIEQENGEKERLRELVLYLIDEMKQDQDQKNDK